MKRQGQSSGYRRQRGATAIEFAIVFPLFFMIFYAIISFGMIFVIQQSLTYAASEGARAGLNYASSFGSVANSCAFVSNPGTRTQNACNAALTALGWLSTGSQQPSVTVTCDSSTANCSMATSLTVAIAFTPQQWMTTIPFVGLVLNGPLTSTAVVQIPQSIQ